MPPAKGVIVTLIALVSKDGYISSGIGVPFDLPVDKQHFRNYTAGKWLLLGRRTYCEMMGWFRDQVPLVLSRDETFQPAFGHRVASVDEAIGLAKIMGQSELVVCGGGGAYAASISSSEKLVITRVERSLGGGVRFPPFEQDSGWQMKSREAYSGPPPFAIEVYSREPRSVIL
jgi:dihydrofolate reductase